jgi:hypothetical protein
MKTPEWFKPAFLGAATGAAALAIVGFSWGGWMTGSSAEKMAAQMSRDQVVAALVPVCLQKSKADPQVEQTFNKLREANSYQRRDIVMEAGWATMPGMSEPDRNIATACLEALPVKY